VLITEKVPPLLRRPSSLIRQVDEGGIQIGDSKEDVGFDDSDTADVTARIASRAVRMVPALASLHLVRSWAALRVMSPDGLPIYERSATCPGAFLVTCHSGITLAAVHALRLGAWLEGAADAPDLEEFSEQRFEISTPA
jgi:glycine/D-amino acid oxidase-like deaminating enzyme